MSEGTIRPPSFEEGRRQGSARVRTASATLAPTLPLKPLPQGEGESCAAASAHSLLRLLAWLSPAFPTGAFAYSHGIEWAVEAGDIADGDTLRDWLVDLLVHGAARSDAILLRHSHKRDADLDALAEFAAATSPARERLAETLNQGAAFMRAARSWGCPVLPDPVAYPVAVGALAGFPRHRRGRDGDGLSAGRCDQPDLSRGPPGAARSIFRPCARCWPRWSSVILRVAAETRGATLDDALAARLRSGPTMAAMRHENPNTRGCSVHDHIGKWSAARRRRRTRSTPARPH